MNSLAISLHSNDPDPYGNIDVVRNMPQLPAGSGSAQLMCLNKRTVAPEHIWHMLADGRPLRLSSTPSPALHPLCTEDSSEKLTSMEKASPKSADADQQSPGHEVWGVGFSVKNSGLGIWGLGNVLGLVSAGDLSCCKGCT